MHRLIALAMLCARVLTADDAYCRSALAKIDTIEQGKAKRGSVIVFSLQEINSWAYYMVPQIVPQGIRNQKVTLGNDTGTAAALRSPSKSQKSKSAKARCWNTYPIR